MLHGGTKQTGRALLLIRRLQVRVLPGAPPTTSTLAAKVSATNQLKALIVGAPEELRAELRGLASRQQIARCAALRDRPTRSLEHRMTIRALRSTARRIQLLAAELRTELERLVAAVAPWCWSCPGWDRSAPPRFWSAGHTPGGCVRTPPCGAGRRQPHPSLLGAGHQASAEPRRGSAAQPGAAHDRAGPATRRPSHPCLCRRRRAEGKSARDIRRCLKRAVARQLFKLLEGHDRAVVEIIRA
jgi:transposase